MRGSTKIPVFPCWTTSVIAPTVKVITDFPNAIGIIHVRFVDRYDKTTTDAFLKNLGTSLLGIYLFTALIL